MQAAAGCGVHRGQDESPSHSFNSLALSLLLVSVSLSRYHTNKQQKPNRPLLKVVKKEEKQKTSQKLSVPPKKSAAPSMRICVPQCVARCRRVSHLAPYLFLPISLSVCDARGKKIPPLPRDEKKKKEVQRRHVPENEEVGGGGGGTCRGRGLARFFVGSAPSEAGVGCWCCTSGCRAVVVVVIVIKDVNVGQTRTRQKITRVQPSVVVGVTVWVSQLASRLTAGFRRIKLKLYSCALLMSPLSLEFFWRQLYYFFF
jgi:hypothetical protein